MKLTLKKPPEMQYIARQIERDIRRGLTIRVVTAIKEVHKSILETPVYTGRTLVNYRWSLGSPIEDRRGAINSPVLPGKTSDLSIGSEPRRQANQAVIDGEFNTLIASLTKEQNPFRRIYLRNNMPNFDDIEYGTYSNKSRTPPGGMTRRGEAKIMAIIKGIEKVG